MTDESDESSEDTPEKRAARRILGEWARSKTPEERDALIKSWTESSVQVLEKLRLLQRRGRGGGPSSSGST